MSKIITVAKKELWSYFSSPTAFIFLLSYLLASLFTFFWVEKFFSRNIADLRPLFEWMPILLIFLISTLTMKMWSEERRMGTVEFLLTLPVKTHELVAGKFLACLTLVAIALVLTFGMPLTVGVLGPVDWGPVFGAYLASLLLASAYLAIGLFVSSRCENQIVSLIVTVLLCGVFYLLGADTIVNLFGNKGGEILRLIGTGSRFEAVSRGLLDFRDIYYYLSITGVFLALNVYSLERLKWSVESQESGHGMVSAVLGLLLANFVAANVWLYKVNAVRVDMTAEKNYSISNSSKEIIEQLAEPLLIRGYFSEKTHPLLAPLVPLVRDYLGEYQLASNGKVRTEFVDPRENEELEAEANRKYNIEPVPFQVADRHSASMLSSYFNIVVQYGDQFEVLGFEELIEIKHDGVGEVDVQLRNLEYDITRSIKKVMHSFNNTDNLFANLKNPVKFVGYISESGLPQQLQTLYGDVKKSLSKYKEKSGGKLELEFLDPSKDTALASKIMKDYGFRPQSLSLFSQESFYFYLTLHDGDKVVSLGVPDDLSIGNFEKSMDSALQRLLPGFLKTVGIYTPPAPAMDPVMMRYAGPTQAKQFQTVQQKLGQNYTTEVVDLKSGVISSDIDILLLISPKDLDEKQVFAVDQFLMQGGTVVLASSPATIEISRSGFNIKEQTSGLEGWLAHHGIDVPKELVMDKQNAGFPEIRKRNVQGITINEPVLAPYPLFIDVRDSGLNQEIAMTSGLGQVNMAWASPIVLDKEKNAGRKLVNLIESSKDSWKTSDLKVEANRNLYPELGFAEGDKKQPHLLAAMVEGSFKSYFSGKESPLIAKKEDKTDEGADDKKGKDEKAFVTGVIDKSPEISRIILFASNEFISDDVLKISGMVGGTQYLNSVQLVENSLDWSTQDRALLAIRSRGHFARTLLPLTDSSKTWWEGLNYVIALLGLLSVFGIYGMLKRNSKQHYKAMNLV